LAVLATTFSIVVGFADWPAGTIKVFPGYLGDIVSAVLILMF
jgi:hypothetical protein